MKHEVRQGGVVMLADMSRRAVRLHHPDLRNCTYTVQDQSSIYPEPFPCPMCGILHIFKTIHLQLNSSGDVAVTPELWEKFQKGGVTELQAAKEVTPRPTALVMPGIDARGEMAPAGFNGEAGQVVMVPRQQPSVYQPGNIISREQGLVKIGGVVRRNAVTPPVDRFKQMPDGTWEEIGGKHG